jgi:hypothetical protein
MILVTISSLPPKEFSEELVLINRKQLEFWPNESKKHS